MPIDLRFPPDWTRRPFEGGEVVVVPGFAFVPDLTIEVFPLLPRLELQPDSLLASRLSPRARLVDVTVAPATSDTGWAMTVTGARVLDERDAPLEVRLLCVYRFLVFAGVVLARGEPRRFAAHQAAILAVLRSARPRFRDDQPAGISELWEMT